MKYENTLRGLEEILTKYIHVTKELPFVNVKALTKARNNPLQVPETLSSNRFYFQGLTRLRESSRMQS